MLSAYVLESVRGGSGNDGLLQRFNLMVWPETSKPFRNVDRRPNREAKETVTAVFRRLDTLNGESVGAFMDDGIPYLRFTDEAGTGQPRCVA